MTKRFYEVLQYLFILLTLCILKVHGKFDPYVDNGGTVLGLAGRDYTIIASDTRLSDQYMIRSRSVARITQVDDGLLFCGAGCWADTVELSKELQIACASYEWEHRAKMRVRALSYYISSELYSRRFFPYYTFCMVGGIDDAGVGAVYRYDAVGSSERVRAACAGKGEHLIQPLIDELTGMEEDSSLWSVGGGGENAFVASSGHFNHREESTGTGSAYCVDIPCEEACRAVLRAFAAAAEREISVGDGVEIWVLRRRTPTSGALVAISPAGNVRYTIEKQFHSLPRH